MDTFHEFSKSIEYLRYLTKGGLPDNFLHIEGGIYSSGNTFREANSLGTCEILQFITSGPGLRIEVVIIENISSRKISINRIDGILDTKTNLRKIADIHKFKSISSSLNSSRIDLGQKEKLIIPTSLWFEKSFLHLDNEQEFRKSSKEVWKSIQSEKLNKTFSWKYVSSLLPTNNKKNKRYNHAIILSKTRSSFRPPSFPKSSDFLFGPSWEISNILVDENLFSLKDIDNTFLSLTYTSEAGSCPILYAWKPEHNQWLRHGKVLHKAQTKALKQSETISYQGWVNKFRLSEEELEASFIDEIHLEVSLKRGQTLSLLPKKSRLQKEDQRTVDIYANEYIEFVFDLPPSVKEADVLKSKLIVTGYYERYSTMLVRALVQKSSDKRELIPAEN